MIDNSSPHSQDDREHLARQWPAPPRRDLPEDRHAVYREVLMQEIDDRPIPTPAPPARPRRWLAWRMAASTAVLGALTAAVAVPAMTSHTGTSPTHTATADTNTATPSGTLDIETVAYSIKVLRGGYVGVTLHTHGDKLDINRFVDDMAKVGIQARVLDCGGTTLGVTEIYLKPEQGPFVLVMKPGFLIVGGTSTSTCSKP